MYMSRCVTTIAVLGNSLHSGRLARVSPFDRSFFYVHQFCNNYLKIKGLLINHQASNQRRRCS